MLSFDKYHQSCVHDTQCVASAQVSGHHPILATKECSSLLFKPFVRREWQFYETMLRSSPEIEPLREFVPRTHGVFEIELLPLDDHESDDEYIVHGDKFILRKVSLAQLHAFLAQRCTCTGRYIERCTVDSLTISEEDATTGYEQPCVIDLKLGTRQHGLYTVPWKCLHQVGKSRKTTSATLGLRHCGSLNYQNGEEHRVTKYDSQHYDDQNFVDSIRDFFFDGQRIRYEVIAVILERLKGLSAYLQTQRSFVFWSSSILIVYDAAAPSGEPRCGLRLIDFAHSYTAKELADRGVDISGPCLDEGAAFGSRQLVKILEDIQSGNTQ